MTVVVTVMEGCPMPPYLRETEEGKGRGNSSITCAFCLGESSDTGGKGLEEEGEGEAALLLSSPLPCTHPLYVYIWKLKHGRGKAQGGGGTGGGLTIPCHCCVDLPAWAVPLLYLAPYAPCEAGEKGCY